MIGLSVCSGIGAPEVAAPWIDWRYQSEIEKFPSAVLVERCPNAVNLGDMTKFQEWPDADVDVLVGGTPCQDASIGYAAGAGVAGNGLDGERSGLAFAFVGIADRYRPRIVVWENVPNILSARHSGGFLRFTRSLADLGYHLAWRVLDARWFGTWDQPRPRLFMVGHLGGAAAAAAVLLEPQGASWNFASGSETAPVLTARGGMAFDDRTPCVLEPGGVRIATPREWERALGFPDGWTDLPNYGRGDTCPDGPRYKALGNSWAVNCGQWVFDRLRMVEEELKTMEVA